MCNRNFRDLIEFQWSRANFLCVGLDTNIEQIPREFHRPGNGRWSSVTHTLITWNRVLIEATFDIAAAYKCNLAPYLAHGVDGLEALKQTINDCGGLAPGKPVILDCKSGDVPHSNEYMAQFAFDYLQVDAITVSPYVGMTSLEPFFCRKDKGIFVLCRTSNSGANEFQDILESGTRSMLHHIVARRVAKHQIASGNLGLVVGALDTSALSEVRSIAPDIPILAPGIGAQGGNISDAYRASKDARGRGILLSVSRSISESVDPRAAAFVLFSQLVQSK